MAYCDERVGHRHVAQLFFFFAYFFLVFDFVSFLSVLHTSDKFSLSVFISRSFESFAYLFSTSHEIFAVEASMTHSITFAHASLGLKLERVCLHFHVFYKKRGGFVG